MLPAGGPLQTSEKGADCKPISLSLFRLTWIFLSFSFDLCLFALHCF